MASLKSQKGQGLIEYLIIVALMGIACLGVLRSINQVINAKFTEVDYALRGKTVHIKKQSIDKSLAKKRDLSNFMKGAGQRDSNKQ